MPVRYSFSGGLFRMDLEGSYTPQDMMETLTAALADPAFPPDPRFLMDVRKSDELAQRDVAEVRMVAEFFAAHAGQVGGRCAIVAAAPVHYGVSRMGAALAESRGAEVEVFTDQTEALQWLGLPEDPATGEARPPAAEEVSET